MASFQVDIVSAERELLSTQAEAVFARSMEGEIGILPGHQPCLLALDIAPLKVVKEDGDTERIAVHNGFLYYRDDRLVVLADVAEVASMIDTQRAEERLRELEEQRGDREHAEVQAAVQRQNVRLSVGGR